MRTSDRPYRFMRLVTIIFLNLTVCATAHTQDRDQIFSAGVTAYPKHYEGPCPVEIVFRGSVHLEREAYTGAPIEYRYKINDGTTTAIESARYSPKARRWSEPVKAVPIRVTDTAPGGQRVFAMLEVLSPESHTSGQYSPLCEKNPKSSNCGAWVKCNAEAKPKKLGTVRAERMPVHHYAEAYEPDRPAGGGETRRDDGESRSTAASTLAIRMRPADENTRFLVRNRGVSGGSAWTLMRGVRLTNLDGWYDLLPSTRGQRNDTLCRNECEATDRCVAFVFDTDPRNPNSAATGGFCGLIFDEPGMRWDSEWIAESGKFHTYVRDGRGISTDPRKIPLVGIEAVGGVIHPNYSKNFKFDVLWNARTRNDGAEGAVECVTRCIKHSQCFAVLMNETGACAGVSSRNTSQPLTKISGFSWSADRFASTPPIFAFVKRYNSGASYRSKGGAMFDPNFSELLEPAGGLGLFSKLAYQGLENIDNSFATRVRARAPSAFVKSGRYGRWTGIAPPGGGVAEVSEGESAIETLDLASFLNADFTEGFLPFHEQVWRSRTERGVYYYAPGSYWFDWNPRSGKLGGAQFFNQAGAIGDGQDVRMQVRLYGGYSPADLEIFRTYVSAVVTANGLPPISDLRPYPATSSSTDFGQAFTGLVAEGGVEVSTQSLGSIGAPVDLVFTVSDVNARSLLDAWTDPAQVSGVSGNIRFTSSVVGGDGVLIPAVLDPFAPGTYGNSRVENRRWNNPSPFPVIIRRVKALKINPDSAEAYYWDVLTDAAVAPGGVVTLTANNEFPEFLFRSMDLIWLDYEIDRSCRSCAENLFGVGAVTADARAKVKFRLADSVTTEYSVDEIEIFMRSRYFDPGVDRLSNSPPIVLRPDEESVESPPLYLPNDMQLGYGEKSYSYKAILYTTDGRELCIPWTESGRTQVRLSRFREGPTGCN